MSTGSALRRDERMERNNAPESPLGDSDFGGGGEVVRPRRAEGGFLAKYKPEQGRVTRTWTVVGAWLLIVWGAMTLRNHLDVFAEEGSEWWRQLISPGIPILVAVVLCAIIWRLVFVLPRSSDFLIATEGEMKKVNWSTRREVIGSTKVVVLFVVLMGVVLFVIDIAFQAVFKWMGVLKV